MIFKEPIFIGIEIIGVRDVWREGILSVNIGLNKCDIEEIRLGILRLLVLKKSESVNELEIEYC